MGCFTIGGFFQASQCQALVLNVLLFQVMTALVGVPFAASSPSNTPIDMITENKGKRSLAFSASALPQVYIVSKRNWALKIDDTGAVLGYHPNPGHSIYGLLQVISLCAFFNNSSVQSVCPIAIRGQEAHRFLCMGSNGTVYSEAVFSRDCAFWEKSLDNNYFNYFSAMNNTPPKSKRKKKRKKVRPWYLGIGKGGVMRLGYKSRGRKDYAQFLKITPDNHSLFPQNTYTISIDDKFIEETEQTKPKPPTHRLPSQNRKPPKYANPESQESILGPRRDKNSKRHRHRHRPKASRKKGSTTSKVKKDCKDTILSVKCKGKKQSAKDTSKSKKTRRRKAKRTRNRKGMPLLS